LHFATNPSLRSGCPCLHEKHGGRLPRLTRQLLAKAEVANSLGVSSAPKADIHYPSMLAPKASAPAPRARKHRRCTVGKLNCVPTQDCRPRAAGVIELGLRLQSLERDFWHFSRPKYQMGRWRLRPSAGKPASGGLFLRFRSGPPEHGTGWLTSKESNSHIPNRKKAFEMW
jgi:hypothetical protein